MTNENVPEPIPESTWRRISAALIEAQREIHKAVDVAHDRLRQRLQVIALDEATPESDDDTNGGQ